MRGNLESGDDYVKGNICNCASMLGLGVALCLKLYSLMIVDLHFPSVFMREMCCFLAWKT